MRGLPRQQVQRMWQQRGNYSQRTLSPRRTSRQIHDERLAGDPADRSAQRCKRRMLQAIRTHSFGQSVDQPLTHQPGGVWSDIPLGQSGASGGDDQLGLPRIVPQCRDDRIDLIRQRPHLHCANSGRFKQAGNRRTGLIRLLSPRAAVTDGNYHGTRIGRKLLIHPPSLRREQHITQTPSAAKDEKIERSVQTVLRPRPIPVRIATFNHRSRLNT